MNKNRKGKQVFYAHSGGVTAVINATACGVIETARAHTEIGTVFAGKHGILGGIKEALIDTNLASDAQLAALRYTPGSAFGSCRYKLTDLDKQADVYARLLSVFRAHDIGYFFYNGGNDSQDTTHKVYQMSQRMGYPLTCIGIPKTIDNDLPFTDYCPGFASTAKYVATAIREAGLDIQSMCSTDRSTKVFILEVMGRHAGWIAAASGLASEQTGMPPHMILFPEVAFDQARFLKQVTHTVNQYGYCTVVASEGIRDKTGAFLTASHQTDAFGHAQLGGVAPMLSAWVRTHCHYKTHWAVADYLQRSARHIASQVDVDNAYLLGKEAVLHALSGAQGVMLTLNRDTHTQWSIGTVALDQVANVEHTLPPTFIDTNGWHITPACMDYLRPLIAGEAYPPYTHGLPDYGKPWSIPLVKKRLPAYQGL